MATLSLVHAAAFCVLRIVDRSREHDDRSMRSNAELKKSDESLVAALPAGILLLVLAGACPYNLVAIFRHNWPWMASFILRHHFAAFLLAVVGLLGFHIVLIFKGLTTYESIESVGPIFSEGCTRNCYNAWCKPVPPPYVDFTMSVQKARALQPPEIIRMYNPQIMGSAV
jgi:hypothetical protein